MTQSEPGTLYKLIILYMLDKSEIPLSNTNISDFILGMDYTNYFTLQQTISDLEASKLITSENPTSKDTLYRITDNGKVTLEYFSDRISDAIKKDVLDYYENHDISLKKDTVVVAEYYNTRGNQYAVRCQIKTNNVIIFEVDFSITGQKQAEIMCENFKNKSDDIFAYLMDMLIQ
ncbi:MAG: DUF4364 family protein [Lachnospiraceae bacterium]|nr:DUF4364 family protein [Lachnospiraceae bacterium]